VSFSEGTTRIELTPQGLGKLEIEISPDEAGKLRVVIRAENPAVLNAMRSDREMLAGLLRAGGTSVDDSAMSFEDLGQRRGTAGQDEAGTLAASALPLADEDELPQETAPPVGDGRLNILT
jgi:flagellar hook-length control protein FliK